MSKECPHCKEKIEYLEVSKQIEGTRQLSDPEFIQIYPIQWKPVEEQKEPLIYTCHVCLAEIEDETLEAWGLK